MTWNKGMTIPDEMQESPVFAILNGWDGADPWGSALLQAFALCDFVAFYLESRDEIPREMNYAPAMDGADENDDNYQDLVISFEAGDFTKADALDYLPIVHRFINACDNAGLSY